MEERKTKIEFFPIKAIARVIVMKTCTGNSHAVSVELAERSVKLKLFSPSIFVTQKFSDLDFLFYFSDSLSQKMTVRLDSEKFFNFFLFFFYFPYASFPSQKKAFYNPCAGVQNLQSTHKVKLNKIRRL